MNPLIQLKTTPLLITLALLFFALPQRAEAVVPPPDGGYPGFNTAEGQNALFSLTTGAANTAVGWFSLFSNTDASFNTATGAGALLFNAQSENTAFGAATLLFNTTGIGNTAVGTAALLNNTTGSRNTAIGAFAMQFNDSDNNTAIGTNVLSGNTTGSDNTGIGDRALLSNTIGDRNTANGRNALASNIDGSENTALGNEAGSNLIDGEGNIYIGTGVQAVATDEFTSIRIGAANFNGIPYDTFISGIYGRPVGSAPLPVVCASDGKLTANPSSRRFKHDIKPIDKSEAVLALKPVTFAYNNETTNSLDFGLIAEDVAEVAPDLVIRDKEGKPFSVHYQGVNAMLLNEFIKEHRKNEEQQKQINVLTAQLKEQAGQIQKVSAQLEASEPAPQVAENNR